MRKEALTPKQIEQLRKDLESQKSFVDIAEKYKISRRTLFNYRKKYEELNQPDRSMVRHFLSQKDIKEIIELRSKGITFNKISSIYNVHYVTLWRLFKKLRVNPDLSGLHNVTI